MEFIEFITILNDNAWNNYQKLSNKYPKDFNGYLELLRNVYYCQIPIKDRYGANVIYQKDRTHITDKVLRNILNTQTTTSALQYLKKKSYRLQQLKTLTSKGIAFEKYFRVRTPVTKPRKGSKD